MPYVYFVLGCRWLHEVPYNNVQARNYIVVSMALRYREWWHCSFGHIVNALIALLKAEEEGRRLTVSELRREAGIPETTFYRTVKEALEKGGLVKYEVDTRERIIEVHLTDKGRKLAQCLKQVYPRGIE